MRRWGVSRRRLLDHQAIVLRRDGRAAKRLDEAGRGTRGDLEIGFMGGDPDGADLLPSDMAVAANQRQQPARIGIVPPPGIDPEPGRALESRPRARFATVVA